MSSGKRGYSAPPPQRRPSVIASFFAAAPQRSRLPWDLDAAERGGGLERNDTRRSMPYSARSGASGRSGRTGRSRKPPPPPRVYVQSEEPYDSEDEEESSAPARRRRAMGVVVAIVCGLYCNGVGTLLTVFVPQTCNNTHCTYAQTMCITWESCTPLQQASLIINFFTFGVAGWALLWFWTREKWLTSHLYRDPHKSARNLPRQMVTFPVLRMRLDRINGRAYVAAQALIVSCVANAALSAVVIVRERYSGGRSIFGFVMQSFLLLPQVVVTWQTANDSRRSGLALSLFRSAQTSYNCMLPSYMEGRYFVSREAQEAEALREELHGAVVDSAAAYLADRLHVVEKHAGRKGPPRR